MRSNRELRSDASPSDAERRSLQPSVTSHRPSRRVPASVPYTVSCEVGRLVEARLFTLRTVEEVADFQIAMRNAFERASGPSIICADWRAAKVLPPDVADAILVLLESGNL